MAKLRLAYVCQSCGASSSKWAGQCPDCGEWNTLVESAARSAPLRGPAARAETKILRLADVHAEGTSRVSSGMAEMDRVLGGGMVPGAVVLIGGDPGIGKSTLLLQVLATMQGSLPTLYVTGEESLSQVRMRAQRLGLPKLDLPVLSETSLEQVLETMRRAAPGLVVLDSIQTLYT